MDFEFLEPDIVIALQAQLIADYGGSHGLRDPGLLESAMMRPLNKLRYEDGNVYVLAAAYLYGLCMNHAFVDGNKRIAITAAALFLAKNGREVTCSEQDLEDITMRVAAGQADEAEAVDFFRRHTQP